MKTLDARISYSIVGNNKYVCHITGNSYPFTDQASSDDAFRLLNENAIEFIRIAEQQAGGNSLTARELLEGVPKAKAPLNEEIARQSAAHKPNQHKIAPPQNPYAQAAEELAEYKHRQKPAGSLLKDTERQAAEWDAERQRELDHEAMLAQPSRQKLVSAIDQRLRDTKYQAVSETEVRRLHDMRNALTSGAAVSEIRESYNQYATEKRDQKSAALAERQQQIDSLTHELNSLRDIPDTESLPAPAYVAPAAKAPETITSTEFERRRAAYKEQEAKEKARMK